MDPLAGGSKFGGPIPFWHFATLAFTVRPAAADAAGTTYVALRNPAAAVSAIFVLALEGTAGFDGIAAVSTQTWELWRFSAATPTGGTAEVIDRNDTANTFGTAPDFRYANAALAVAGVVFAANPFGRVTMARALSNNRWAIRFPRPKVLRVGEGIALRNGAAAVVGDSISGTLQFYQLPVEHLP